MKLIPQYLLALIWCASFMTTSSLSAVDIIAHRGSSFLAPENTVASCALAWEERADAVELDVHLTRDGKLAVIHDADTKRTTGAPGLVREGNWSGLQALDAGSWKSPKYTGEKIPSLDDCLANGPDGRRFFIEVKCGPEAVPELVASLGRSGLKPDQVVIISFSREVVAAVKKAAPEYRSLWLVGGGRDKAKGRTPTLDEVIAEAKALSADGLDLSAAWPIDVEFVAKVKKEGLGLWVWTVDDPAHAQRLKDAGVDGITTNRPGWLRERLH
jgi:glycerophosphoryl diester phosphodiesterase